MFLARRHAHTLRAFYDFKIEVIRRSHHHRHIWLQRRSTGQYKSHCSSHHHDQNGRLKLCLACSICRRQAGTCQTRSERRSKTHCRTRGDSDYCMSLEGLIDGELKLRRLKIYSTMCHPASEPFGRQAKNMQRYSTSWADTLFTARVSPSHARSMANLP